MVSYLYVSLLLINVEVSSVTDPSRVSGFIGKMESLRWTPHMEDCLAVLEREMDHPSDAQLVFLVKIQLVAEEAQKLLVRDVIGDSSQAPTYVFKKGLLSQLQEIRGGLPPRLADSCKFQIRNDELVLGC